MIISAFDKGGSLSTPILFSTASRMRSGVSKA
jgi:hypothetical protein